MGGAAMRTILLATALFIQALGQADAKTGTDDGPTLTVHVTLCPFGVTSAFDLACSITPAKGFLVQVNPLEPAIAVDSRGDMIAPLPVDAEGRVVIEVIPPTTAAGPYDLDGFCGPSEAVRDIARADPGGDDLALIFSVTDTADIACWISMVPLTEPGRESTPSPAAETA